MDKIIRAMYPDCKDDHRACFERYLRDRVENMKKHNIHKLNIGTFEDSYFEQFKNVERDFGGEFWWSPHSWNVGTVKNQYVYSFTLFWLKKSQAKFIQHMEDMMEGMQNMSFPSFPMMPSIPPRMPSAESSAESAPMLSELMDFMTPAASYGPHPRDDGFESAKEDEEHEDIPGELVEAVDDVDKKGDDKKGDDVDKKGEDKKNVDWADKVARYVPGC